MAIQAPTTAKNAVRIGAHHQRADASVDAIPANPKLAKPVATLRRESTIAMMNLLLLYWTKIWAKESELCCEQFHQPQRNSRWSWSQLASGKRPFSTQSGHSV